MDQVTLGSTATRPPITKLTTLPADEPSMKYNMKMQRQASGPDVIIAPSIAAEDLDRLTWTLLFDSFTVPSFWAVYLGQFTASLNAHTLLS